jgi:hypothetical protein
MNPLALILVVILVLLCVGGLPTWGYHSYGYYPSIGLGTVLVIILIIWLLGGLR